MTEFDPTKPFKCANGWEAELYSVERRHGAVKAPDGTWLPARWSNLWTGSITYYTNLVESETTQGISLVNLPEPKLPWPQNGEAVWWVSSGGEVGLLVFHDFSPLHQGLVESGNLYRTEKLAEKAIRIQRTRVKLRAIQEDCNEEWKPGPRSAVQHLVWQLDKDGARLDCSNKINEWYFKPDGCQEALARIRSEISPSALKELFGVGDEE